MTSIPKLTYRPGAAGRHDVDVLTDVADQYAESGEYADAALVWQLVGELASAETTSFRERYDLTPTPYACRLAELFDLSNNPRRAALVRDMLDVMDKPNGVYL